MAMTDLETRIADVCGVLNAAHAQLVSLVAEALETGAWDVAGIRGPQHWVAWKTGFSPARFKQVVHIASQLTALPISDTPRVTPQPLREPAPKPRIEPRITPAVAEPYEPTDADIERWAQERQAFFDEQRRLVRAELKEIERLEHAN